MKKEAEDNAEADRQRQEQVEARNEADTTAYAGEKFLKENEDKATVEYALTADLFVLP
jgi:molecular chaperone DnaK